MNNKSRARNLLNSIFKRYGSELINSSLVYNWQRYPRTMPGHKEVALPKGAEEYLRLDNPRFIELKKRYASFNEEVTVPLLWKEGYVRPEDLLYFRGDNPFCLAIERTKHSHIQLCDDNFLCQVS